MRNGPYTCYPVSENFPQLAPAGALDPRFESQDTVVGDPKTAKSPLL
jgi:hypothetical protein